MARLPLLTRVVLTNHNNYATYLLITDLALENYNSRNTFDGPYNVLSKCSFQKTPNNKQHVSPKYGNTMKKQPDLKNTRTTIFSIAYTNGCVMCVFYCS